MISSELKSNARKLMLENAPKLFFVTVAYLVIVTVMSELQFRLINIGAAYDLFIDQVTKGAKPNIGLLVSGIKPSGAALACVLGLSIPIIDTGFASFCLKVARRREGGYLDILDGFSVFGKALLIFIVTSILKLLWSLLFFFPGIAASYRYRQSYYILLDDPKKGALQCIRESKRLMHGRKIELFFVDLTFFGWYLLGLLVAVLVSQVIRLPFSLPVVSIWFAPYYGLTCAEYYNRLIGRLVA